MSMFFAGQNAAESHFNGTGGGHQRCKCQHIEQGFQIGCQDASKGALIK